MYYEARYVSLGGLWLLPVKALILKSKTGSRTPQTGSGNQLVSLEASLKCWERRGEHASGATHDNTRLIWEL